MLLEGRRGARRKSGSEHNPAGTVPARLGLSQCGRPVKHHPTRQGELPVFRYKRGRRSVTKLSNFDGVGCQLLLERLLLLGKPRLCVVFASMDTSLTHSDLRCLEAFRFVGR